jgi:ankyrin repeat protein
LQHNNVEADSKDIKNRTPLSHAAQCGDRAKTVVRLLLERNDVDADSKDIRNRTPLSYAVARWGDRAETVVRLLLERNDVDANTIDNRGYTPLYYATMCQRTAENVLRLLQSARYIPLKKKWLIDK